MSINIYANKPSFVNSIIGPLCRFELPTNDIFYEEERLKRLYDNKDQDNNDSYSSMFL